MRKAKIVSCLLLAASALLPLAGHAQDRGRGDERGGPPMGRGHGDRDRGWDRHHGDEGRGPVDIDRRADRDRPGRWAKGDRIPRNTASANISSTTGAPTTWPAAARLPLGRRRRRLFPGRPDRYRLQRDDRRLTRACRTKPAKPPGDRGFFVAWTALRPRAANCPARAARPVRATRAHAGAGSGRAPKSAAGHGAAHRSAGPDRAVARRRSAPWPRAGIRAPR